jgi:hypothetical protein
MPVSATASTIKMVGRIPHTAGGPGPPGRAEVGQTVTIQRTKLLVPSPVSGALATMRRATSITRSLAETVSGTLVRRTLKPLAKVLTSSPSVDRGKIFSLILFTTQKVGHEAIEAFLTATQATTATLTPLLVKMKTVSATQSQGISIIKARVKTLVTGSQLPLPPVFHSVSPVPSISSLFLRGKAFSVTQGSLATLLRFGARLFSLAQGSVAVLVSLRVSRFELAVTQAQVATLSLLMGALRFVSQTAQAVVTRTRLLPAIASQSVVAILNRRSEVSLFALANTLGSLLAEKVAVLKVLTTSAAATVALRFVIARSLVVDLVSTLAVVVLNAAITLVSSVQVLVVSLGRGFTKLLALAQAQSVQLAVLLGREFRAIVRAIAALILPGATRANVSVAESETVSLSVTDTAVEASVTITESESATVSVDDLP